MSTVDERIKRVSLIDCSEPFVSLVAKLGSQHAQTPAEDLRAPAERVLAELERDAQRQGVGITDIEAAKYALAALLDEKVLCGEFAATADWINEPLQVRLFGSFAAGEEFYQRIDDLRRDPVGPRLLALEVYHLALGLGFKGKHEDRRGEEQRKLLMDQIAEMLAQARGAGAGLSPNAYRPPSEDAAASQTAWWHRLPLWAYPAAALALVLLTTLVMSLVVGSAAGDVRALVEGG
jgi:type VI secretion system protein ImpK